MDNFFVKQALLCVQMTMVQTLCIISFTRVTAHCMLKITCNL